MTDEEFEALRRVVRGGFMYVALEGGADEDSALAEFDSFVAECERRGAQRAALDSTAS